MMVSNFCYTLEINGKTERGESFAQRRDGKIHQKFGPQNIAYHHINSKSNLKVRLYVKKHSGKESLGFLRTGMLFFFLTIIGAFDKRAQFYIFLYSFHFKFIFLGF